MKIGDKLYCHTEYTTPYTSTPNNWIKKGNTYTIIKMSETYATIIDEEGDENDFQLYDDFYGIDKYFLHSKKLRKLKIDKINERRR